MPTGFPDFKFPEDMKEFVRESRKSPIYFIQRVWKLTPQTVRKDFRHKIDEAIRENKLENIKQEYFLYFRKNMNITWQQWVILLAVEKALAGELPNRITVKSGHGIGKSTVMAWLLIWFMFCWKNCQIPCTAPTSSQLFDVLWKEAAKWIEKMPRPMKACYEWQSEYIRMVGYEHTWFARARTGKKESPEALAGMHADHMLYLVDEASGIPDEIFNTAEGALTGKNYVFVMISNPTRLEGYFYDSHKHSEEKRWQQLTFSSLESPIVEEKYLEDMNSKHGVESDEYKVRVKGEFPEASVMDKKGWINLLAEHDLKYTSNGEFNSYKRMAVDPSGEGSNETTWVVRDKFKAKIVAKESVSNEKSIAEKTLTLMNYYGVQPESIYIDNFGKGANVAQELALAGAHVNGINVGNPPDDPEIYLNKRAECYHRMKEWLRTGGELVNNPDWEQLLDIKYKRNIRNKVQIMSKKEMRAEGVASPDAADALMMTFYEEDDIEDYAQQEAEVEAQYDKGTFDPYAVI